MSGPLAPVDSFDQMDSVSVHTLTDREDSIFKRKRILLFSGASANWDYKGKVV